MGIEGEHSCQASLKGGGFHGPRNHLLVAHMDTIENAQRQMHGHAEGG